MNPFVLACVAITLCLASAHGSKFDLGAIIAPLKGALGAPKTPVFPDAYKMQYTLLLPYITSVQSEPFSMRVAVWYDGPSQKLRMDIYDGLDITYITPDATWTVYPRIDKLVCSIVNNTVGPTLGGGAPSDMPPPLPDLSTWTYAGTSRPRGGPVSNVWQYAVRVEDKISTYSFFVTAEDHPVKLHIMGYNTIGGSHYDEYLFEFQSFVPGPVTVSSFQPPKVCQHPIEPNQPGLEGSVRDGPRRMAGQALSLLPSSSAGSAALIVAAGTTAAAAGPAQPHAHLRANMDLVHAWNAKNADDQGFKLALNRFATWSPAQYSAMLGTVGSHTTAPSTAAAAAAAAAGGMAAATGRAGGALLGRPGHGTMQSQQALAQQLLQQQHGAAWLGEYQRVLEDHQLPESVDWRGTPADGPVKDQASCGSCWAFAAVGALQGAWYNATGMALSLSEQQLVDCSWRFRNGGCGGGWPAKAIEYLVKEKAPLQPEEAYPYVGANDYCAVSSGGSPKSGGAAARHGSDADAARFSGFKTVKSKDEKAVMEAVALHGPLAISIDAAHPTFKFYSEGVYYRKDCGNTPDDMDHAVVLVGYGTEAHSGKDYWLIRNSWSTFWGSDGYVKIARKGNDCGVTLEVVMAIADEPAAAGARARLAAAKLLATA